MAELQSETLHSSGRWKVDDAKGVLTWKFSRGKWCAQKQRWQHRKKVSDIISAVYQRWFATGAFTWQAKVLRELYCSIVAAASPPLALGKRLLKSLVRQELHEPCLIFARIVSCGYDHFDCELLDVGE